MSLLTHLLSCLFGLGSWVSINGLWVELPLLVPQIPEGWFLPSYLSVLIQMANVGPLFVTLMHRFKPGVLNEAAVVYAIVAVGTAASVLLGFFWKETLVVVGAPRSVALLVLTFFLATVDCTSSVTFLPFMMRLQPQYLTSYFIGEGVSGLLPAMVALIQGVGVVRCVNASESANWTSVAFQSTNLTSNAFQSTNLTSNSFQSNNWTSNVFQSTNQTSNSFQSTNQTSNSFQSTNQTSNSFQSTNQTSNSSLLQAQYQPANFSPEEFFFFLGAMMLVCLAAFVLLNHHPAVARDNPKSRYTNGVKQKNQRGGRRAEQKPMMEPYGLRKPRSSFGSGAYSWPQVSYILALLGWTNALTNVVLPSVQSYSCLPYGNSTYHLSASLAAVANPLACFIAMFFPVRSLVLMGVLTVCGSAVGAFIMSMAVMSPCPLLVHESAGAVIMVLSWVLFVLTLSYVKVMIGLILRDEGHGALVLCGAVVQLGSLLGAVAMFPLVSVFGFFSSGDPCNTRCP